MLQSIALLSALTTTALAQSLIPTGISSDCSAFLTSLNSNADLKSFVEPLIKATAQFAPNANKSPSAASVNSALDAACASKMDDQVIRQQLTTFSSACSPELTVNKNPDVTRDYDVVYILSPMTKAICSKCGDSYCLPLNSEGGNAKGSLSTGNDYSQYLASPVVGAAHTKRAPTVQAALVPNTTTFSNNYIAFGGIDPTWSKDQLCTDRTKNILLPYADWESTMPYAPGIANSGLLSGQSEIFNAVKTSCGANFLGSAVATVGGIAGGVSLGGASKMVGGANTALVALTTLAMGVFAML